MMSEPTKVDGLTTDELTGKLVLLIEERRPWQETNLMHRQLATKVKNYVRHIRSQQFHERHGRRPKDTIVRLVTVERPGKATVDLLERIGYELQKFEIEFEYEVASDSVMGPTPVKPTAPPRAAPPKPKAPEPGGQQPPARPPQTRSPGPTPPTETPPAPQRPAPSQPEPPQPTQPPAGQPPERPAAQGPEPPAKQQPLPSQPSQSPGVEKPEPEPDRSDTAKPSDALASDPFLEYLQAEQDREGSQARAEPTAPDAERGAVGGPGPAARMPTAGEAEDETKPPEVFPEEEFGRLLEYGAGDDMVVESSSGKRTSLGRAGDVAGDEPRAFTTYAEQVAAEKPSVWRALLAGLTGAISGSVLWTFMAAAVGSKVSPVAIAVGFMVGWSIRVRARGTNIVYRIIAVIFTILGTLLGTGLVAATVVALGDSAGVAGIIANLSDQSTLLAAVVQVFGFLDLLSYAIALYLAFRIATPGKAAEESGTL